jgi:signal peptidase I
LRKKREKPSVLTKADNALALSGIHLSTLLQAVVSRKKPFRFKARGFSMSPSIKDGDVLTVYPMTKRRPVFGDIVAYLQPQTRSVIIHRIVAKKKSFYRLRGDNALSTEGFIPDKNILGLVKKIERNGQKACFGLGPERFFIALLSRSASLLPLKRCIQKIIRPNTRSSAA